MSTIIRELTDIQGVEVSAPTENPFTASGLEVFATDAAYEVVRPTPGAGEFYFNSTYGAVRVYNGTAWQFDKTTFTAQTDAASTGAGVDLAPNTTDQIIRFTEGSLSSIRSINPANQRLLYLYNGQASTGITLKNEDAGATAANRIKCGLDYVIQAGQLVTLIYDEDQARWLIASKPVTGLEAFVDDAAYVTAHGPAAAGSRYWNTTSNVVREHDGNAWFNNRVAFETEVNSALTGADQDIVPARKQIIKVTNASLTSVRSVSPLIVQFLILINGTGAALSIKNESTAATASERIITGTGSDLSMKADSSIIMAYDSDSLRWRVAGGSGSGSGSGSGINCCLSPNDVAIQWTQAQGYGWYSSAATAASTTTTASECPLAPLVNTAIKLTRTTAASYDAWRFKIPAALKNNTIPISWLQIPQTGAVSGEFKIDVYTYTDAAYTTGATRKNLRSDSSSVTSIPAYTGYFGSNNAISFDTGSEDYYEVRFTRVSGTNWLAMAGLKIGFDQVGVAAAHGEYESTNSFTIGAITTAPTPGTGAKYYRNTYKAGRWAIIRYEFTQSIAGTAGSGDYLLPIPSGLAIDTNRVGKLGASSTLGAVGSGMMTAAAVTYEVIASVSSSASYANKIHLFLTNETAGHSTWSAAVAALSNASVTFSVDVRVPIVGWDDAVVVGPSNSVEYVSHDGTTQSSDWALVPNIAGATGNNQYDITPNFLCQSDDILEIEFKDGSGNVISNGAFPWLQGTGSYNFGAQVRKMTNGQIKLYAGNGGPITSSGLGAAAAGNTWADFRSIGYMWRVRKSKPGIPAGLEHGQLHGGAQLYRAGYAPGSLTGTAIPTSMLGENLTAATNIAASVGVETQVVTRTLTTGVWDVSGSLVLIGGSGFTHAEAFAYHKGSYSGVYGQTYFISSVPSGQYLTINIPTSRIVIADADATKTVALKAKPVGGGCTAYGYINATRAG